jgi:branched-chain amino acid transport system permease protein
MLSIELKREKVIFRWGNNKKSEWIIEPRYWRYPALGVLTLMIVPLLLYNYPRYLTLFTTANLYAILAMANSVQMVGTGRVNFGPQLYLGVGGYTAALLNLHLGWSPTATLATAILACLALALLLSPITWVARGLYFSLITLILPLLFLDITYAFGDIFRGEVGVSGMSPLLQLNKILWNYTAYAYFSVIILLLVLFVADRILKSRIGLNMAAINENDEVAKMMGLNVNKYKSYSYILTSVLIGIVGWFIVHTFRAFAGVTYLPLDFMLKILFITLIGGRAFLYGAIPGAYFIALLEHSLRPLGPINYVIFPSALLILIVFFGQKEGLWGIFQKRHHTDYYPKIRVRR